MSKFIVKIILGTALGAYFCQMLDVEGPVVENQNRQLHPGPSYCNDTTPRNKVIKPKGFTIKKQIFFEKQLINFHLFAGKPFKSSVCSICLETFKPLILFLPCSHMCICHRCYETSRDELCNKCPICRETINDFKRVKNL